MKAAQRRHVKELRNLLKTDRPVSELETQCIERQIDMHKTAKAEGLVWDEDEAEAACLFFRGLRHWKGRWANKPLDLQPWQRAAIVAPIFGWWRDDGTRLARQGYVEVPRKNGKTTLFAGIANRGLMFDAENGVEVYAAATKRDQALILFKDAKKILGDYQRFCKVNSGSIEFEPLAGTFQPLSADHNSMDGLNVHMGIVDEMHAHKDRGVYDVLLTAMGSRENPFLGAITTAGVDRSSICWELREILRQILAGHMAHPSFFGFIATCDENDDPSDPLTWWKANPNLYVTISESYLADVWMSSKVSGAGINNFLRKHLNRWVGQVVRWIPLDRWDSNAEEMPDDEYLRGLPAWAAIDLASTRDLNAMAIVFLDGPKFYVKVFFWAPEDAINERAQRDRRQVRRWMDVGFVTSTPGDTADPDRIAQDAYRLLEQFDVSCLAFDPWNSGQFLNSLVEHCGYPESKLVEFRQTITNYAPACKTFEQLVFAHKLIHDGHPVLRWNVDNMAARIDANENKRPDKDKSADKIDGAVAVIMAIGEAVHGESQLDSYVGGFFLDS